MIYHDIPIKHETFAYGYAKLPKGVHYMYGDDIRGLFPSDTYTAYIVNGDFIQWGLRA